MDQSEVTHYCVRCLSSNPVGQDLCWNCGTRLMLMVDTPTRRFEESGIVGTHIEHLLERISALENRLNRLGERLSRTLEYETEVNRRFDEQSRKFDALVAILVDEGLVPEAKSRTLGATSAREAERSVTEEPGDSNKQ